MISKFKSACSRRREEAEIVEHVECPPRYLGGYDYSHPSKTKIQIMKKFFVLLISLALLPGAYAKLNVVATLPDLASIAKEIGGDKIDITTLARPTEDPHFVDAKPSYIVKLNHADVLIEGGAELEIGWLPALLDQARNEKLAAGAPGHVSAAQGVQLLEIPSALDRSKGDIHAAGNPHYLVDLVNVCIAA